MSIAIVVDIVADGVGMALGGLLFRARYHKADARAPTPFGLAGLPARLTSADAASRFGAGITIALSARFAGAIDAIVDSAITIVVEAIADLAAGESLIVASAPTVVLFAVLDAEITKAGALGADGAGVTAPSLALFAIALQAFIDLAIAVVVETIARFLLGEGLTDTGRP